MVVYVSYYEYTDRTLSVGRPSSFAEAKKIKSSMLHNCGCLKTDCSSSTLLYHADHRRFVALCDKKNHDLTERLLYPGLGRSLPKFKHRLSSVRSPY